MMYVLENNFGRYFKRMNKFNVSECDEIGLAKMYKTRYQADFANSQLKENFKVVELTEDKYTEMYNKWYELKYTYQESNEINITIK